MFKCLIGGHGIKNINLLKFLLLRLKFPVIHILTHGKEDISLAGEVSGCFGSWFEKMITFN